MKIYFEDGELVSTPYLPFNDYYKIDAKYGPKHNRNMLDIIKECSPDRVIYTNSLIALSNEYAWNEELGVPEIYIRAGEYMCFARIDTLTERELRYAHNICKMYLAGAFDTTTSMTDAIYGESKTKQVIDKVMEDIKNDSKSDT